MLRGLQYSALGTLDQFNASLIHDRQFINDNSPDTQTQRNPEFPARTLPILHETLTYFFFVGDSIWVRGIRDMGNYNDLFFFAIDNGL